MEHQNNIGPIQKGIITKRTELEQNMGHTQKKRKVVKAPEITSVVPTSPVKSSAHNASFVHGYVHNAQQSHNHNDVIRTQYGLYTTGQEIDFVPITEPSESTALNLAKKDLANLLTHMEKLCDENIVGMTAMLNGRISNLMLKRYRSRTLQDVANQEPKI